MRTAYLILCILLAVSNLVAREPRIYTAEVVRIIDGDTIRVFLNLGFDGLYKLVDLRVSDIDTPEIFRPLNDKEKARGIQARTFTQNLCPVNSIIRVDYIGLDKYGGRIDALVYPSGSNISLGVSLKKAGFQK